MRKTCNIVILELTVLAVILILGLLAIYWSLVSDANRVIAVAGVALAVATILLATVAFFQMQESRRQAEEAQHAQLRPLLIPHGSLPHDLENLHNSLSHNLDIRNVGAGVATNVNGVIILPHSDPVSRPKQFCLYLQLPIASGESVQGLFKLGGYIFTAENELSNKTSTVSLGVPKDRVRPATYDPRDRRDYYLAQLVITYSDVLGSKHASVFYLTTLGAWVSAPTFNYIQRDLVDMDEANGK